VDGFLLCDVADWHFLPSSQAPPHNLLRRWRIDTGRNIRIIDHRQVPNIQQPAGKTPRFRGAAACRPPFPDAVRAAALA
jgi:hypothetical protein